MPPPDPADVVFCRGKVRHPSRKIAAENLNRVRLKLRGKKRERGALQVYFCAACLGFHLGNRRDGEVPRAGRPKPPPPEPIWPEEEAA